MKICYLVLAHDNPKHFKRLCDAISTGTTGVFVHIDKKCNISDFRGEIDRGNIIFITKRIPVYWGSFSQVEAIINLLKEALLSKCEYEYFCLISGNDYPLKSPIAITDFFKKNQGKEYIELVSLPNSAACKFLSRITTFYGEFHDRNIVAKTALRLINKMRIQRSYQKVFKDMTPYAGSTWWALTRSACQYVIKFIDANSRFAQFMRNTAMPDESFFHTIIGNSRFRHNCNRNLTFVDWPGANHPNPAIISKMHVEKFRKNSNLYVDDVCGKGPLLFARKFPDDSEELTQIIRDYVW